MRVRLVMIVYYGPSDAGPNIVWTALPVVQWRWSTNMIPNEAKNQFQDIITHEMFEMDRALAGTLAATHSTMISRGLGQSGPAMQLLTQDATNSLKARAQLILGQLLRCLTAHHVPLTPEAVTEASTLLREAIHTQAQLVRSRLFGNPVFATRGVEQARQQLQTQYDQEGPRLIARLGTELKLAAAASQASPSRSTPTFTFNGPVGLVQTGDGSRATVHQHVDAEVKNEIVSALKAFLEQLDKPENRGIGNHAELRELVVEAKAEAEKSESNALKLGSSLRTIAETTKFVGSLGPAYEVLKPLLSYFGIHLP